MGESASGAFTKRAFAASQRSFLSTRTAIVPSRIVSLSVDTFSKLASDGWVPRQARAHC